MESKYTTVFQQKLGTQSWPVCQLDLKGHCNMVSMCLNYRMNKTIILRLFFTHLWHLRGEMALNSSNLHSEAGSRFKSTMLTRFNA